MGGFQLSGDLSKRVTLCGAAISVLLSAVGPLATSVEASPVQAAAGAKDRNASNLDRTRRVSRAIVAIDARLQRCYAASKPTGPPEVMACNEKATGAFEALLRPSRQKEFEAFLHDLYAPLFHFLTKDGAGEWDMEGVISAGYRDVARKRTAILSGADRHPLRLRRGHPSLNQLLGKLHGDPMLYQYHYGQRLQQHWTKVRNADCAAHPVPLCAERLDAVLAEELEGDFNDK
jgi:hypothetical protein